jgi:sorbitol-specific phosphotransferase system component IIBC
MFIFSFVSFVIALLAVVIGYSGARRFVRDRLRYVDGAQKGTAPIVAGIVAFLIALPLSWLLPLVGTGTAIAFAISVATGVASGARDIKSGNYTSLPRV